MVNQKGFSLLFVVIIGVLIISSGIVGGSLYIKNNNQKVNYNEAKATAIPNNQQDESKSIEKNNIRGKLLFVESGSRDVQMLSLDTGKISTLFSYSDLGGFHPSIKFSFSPDGDNLLLLIGKDRYKDYSKEELQQSEETQIYLYSFNTNKLEKVFSSKEVDGIVKYTWLKNNEFLFIANGEAEQALYSLNLSSNQIVKFLTLNVNPKKINISNLGFHFSESRDYVYNLMRDYPIGTYSNYWINKKNEDSVTTLAKFDTSKLGRNDVFNFIIAPAGDWAAFPIYAKDTFNSLWLVDIKNSQLEKLTQDDISKDRDIIYQIIYKSLNGDFFVLEKENFSSIPVRSEYFIVEPRKATEKLRKLNFESDCTIIHRYYEGSYLLITIWHDCNSRGELNFSLFDMKANKTIFKFKDPNIIKILKTGSYASWFESN